MSQTHLPGGQAFVDIMSIVFEGILYDDYHKKNIFACSLVSKEWRSVALKYCFRSVSLFVRPTPEPGPGETPINRFMQDFLKSTILPIVRNYVQRLRLGWGTGARGQHIQFTFVDYLPLFPALRCLHVVGGLASRMPEPMRHLSGTLELEHLAIEGQSPVRRRGELDSSHDPMALFDMLGLFRSLKSLELENLQSWRRDSTAAAWTTLPLPRLSSLTMQNMPHEYTPPVISDFFAATSILVGLKHLDVVDSGLCRELQHEIFRVAESIEHLATIVWSSTIAFRVYGENTPPRDITDLSSFVALKSLVLSVRLHYGEHILGNAADLLSTIPASVKLEYIELRIEGESASSRDMMMEKTRQLLAGASDYTEKLEDALLEIIRTRHLGYIRAGIYASSSSTSQSPYFYQPSQDEIRMTFPRLQKLGVLHS